MHSLALCAVCFLSECIINHGVCFVCCSVAPFSASAFFLLLFLICMTRRTNCARSGAGACSLSLFPMLRSFASALSLKCPISVTESLSHLPDNHDFLCFLYLTVLRSLTLCQRPESACIRARARVCVCVCVCVPHLPGQTRPRRRRSRRRTHTRHGLKTPNNVVACGSEV